MPVEKPPPGGSTDADADDADGSAVLPPAVDWSLEASIWSARGRWCDAGGLLDSEQALYTRFSHDWRAALNLGLGDWIAKYDDDGTADEGSAMGDGVPDEVGMGMCMCMCT